MRHSSSQKDKKFVVAKQLGKNARTEDSSIRALVSLFEQSLVEKARVHLHSKRSARTTTVVLDAPLRAKDTVSHRRQTMQLVATVPLPQQILTLFLAYTNCKRPHKTHYMASFLEMMHKGHHLSNVFFGCLALIHYIKALQYSTHRNASSSGHAVNNFNRQTTTC